MAVTLYVKTDSFQHANRGANSNPDFQDGHHDGHV